LNCSTNKEVYVWSNGVHLDLIIPRDELAPELLAKLDLPKWVKYAAFGWGDKEFYINTPTWADVKFTPTFNALFTNSQSALHVVWYPDRNPKWISVPLCEQQMNRIREYVGSSFEKDTAGQFQEVYAAGYTDRDKFYLAQGNFSVFRTCNQWVNQALKQAGVRTAVWSPFDKGVLYHVRE